MCKTPKKKRKGRQRVGMVNRSSVSVDVSPISVAEGFVGYALSNKITALLQAQFPALSGSAITGATKIVLAYLTDQGGKMYLPEYSADATAAAVGMGLSGFLDLYREYAPDQIKDFVGIRGLYLHSNGASNGRRLTSGQYVGSRPRQTVRRTVNSSALQAL